MEISRRAFLKDGSAATLGAFALPDTTAQRQSSIIEQTRILQKPQEPQQPAEDYDFISQSLENWLKDKVLPSQTNGRRVPFANYLTENGLRYRVLALPTTFSGEVLPTILNCRTLPIVSKDTRINDAWADFNSYKAGRKIDWSEEVGIFRGAKLESIWIARWFAPGYMRGPEDLRWQFCQRMGLENGKPAELVRIIDPSKMTPEEALPATQVFRYRTDSKPFEA